MGRAHFGEGELGPHLTQCGRGKAHLNAKFHLDPSNVWPQYTNVTERQTGQTDNGLIARGEPFYKRSPN